MAQTCPTCGGSGTVNIHCTHCHGTGFVLQGRENVPCPECNGTGLQEVYRTDLPVNDEPRVNPEDVKPLADPNPPSTDGSSPLPQEPAPHEQLAGAPLGETPEVIAPQDVTPSHDEVPKGNAGGV